MTPLEEAALWVTGREGGKLVSDPWLSRWGISLQYHSEVGADGVRNMTQPAAAKIIAQQYWIEVWNPLPPYIVIPVLSFAVLEGTANACYAIQRGLGVTVDGKFGPQTYGAADAALPSEFLEEFYGACLDQFEKSPRWVKDGKGWCKRQAAAWVAAERGRPS